MQPSSELQEFIRHGFEVLVAKDAEGLLQLFTTNPGILGIGTAPGEWWEGREAFEVAMRATVPQGSGRFPADLTIQAFEEGTVGWAAATYSAKLPNGNGIIVRYTSVCHKEQGAWRAVQTHLSVAIPDELVPTIAQPGL